MRISESADMREVLVGLLEHARPDGYAHKRLTKYLGQIDRGVFLSPRYFSYIEELIQRIDNIECEFLDNRESRCRKIGTPCPHTKLYRTCAKYSARKADKIKGGDFNG